MTTKVLSRSMIDFALRDNSFTNKFPEFNNLKQLTGKPKGCTRCRAVENENSFSVSSFYVLAESLNSAKREILKNYFRTDSLQYRLNNQVRQL